MVRGRARKLGLGGFSTVSLAEARELARANRKLAREGGDPRAGGRHHTAGVPTFEEAAHKVLAIHKGAWRKGSKTASQWEGSLRDHAFPELAGKSVDRGDDGGHDGGAAAAVDEQVRDGAEGAAPNQRGHEVGDGPGLPDRQPGGGCAARGAPRRPTPVRHRRALSHGDVAEALAKVRTAKTWEGIRLAFEFLVLTATRSGRGPAGDVEGGRPGLDGVDDPGRADEGEARAPDSAEQAGRRGAAGRGAAAPVAAAARAGVHERPRDADRRFGSSRR